MSRVVRGVVRGKTIEVREDLGMLDGQAVELIVTMSPFFYPKVRRTPKGRICLFRSLSGSTGRHRCRCGAW